jgi:hypothetical protein
MKPDISGNMNRIYLLSTLITLISVIRGHPQTTQDSIIIENTKNHYATGEIKGSVLDLDKQTALPYTSIYILHKNIGLISNENGNFSINSSDLDKTDTLCFQYIGYKNRCLTIGHFDTSSVVYLKADITNLNQIFIFGNSPDPESIVKKVLENKDSNYRKTTSKRQTFIRERSIADIDKINLIYKKSTISDLNRDFIKSLEDKIPRHTTSYTDFLGDLYFTKNKDDSINLKIDPIRTVSLKEKDIAELKQFETVFENIFANTGEKEYWKVKSGIFGEKLDSVDVNHEPERDTLIENKRNLSDFGREIKSQLNFSSLNDKDQWEFLHKTGRYIFTLAGGTSVNGEDVYIIDFTPRVNGLYVGRMYISTNTFALIRADYEYAPGKIGHDIHLLGIGYTETQFIGSIYFEKKENNYALKYFSKRAAAKVSINRNIALLQKRKRALFDEKVNEFKMGLDISVDADESFEYLVLDDRDIPDKQFEDFKQQENMEVVYVDQFDDKLWSGFSIIEPTKQMKEYKKQEVNYSE